MIAEIQGPIICAWCETELKRGVVKSPMSHGICLACLAAAADHPLEDLSNAPSELLDALPFGVIQIRGDGTIVGYNRQESALSGLSAGRVIGKNFFLDIAPCTAVKEFQGTLEAMRARGKNDRAKLRFVFTFARGAKLVEVAMVYDAKADASTLLVKVVLSEPKL